MYKDKNGGADGTRTRPALKHTDATCSRINNLVPSPLSLNQPVPRRTTKIVVRIVVTCRYLHGAIARATTPSQPGEDEEMILFISTSRRNF
jgi:hypothetical protein